MDSLVATDADKARTAALWQSVGSLIFGYDNGGVELSLRNTGNGIQADAQAMRPTPAAPQPQTVSIAGAQFPLLPLLVVGGLVVWALAQNAKG